MEYVTWLQAHWQDIASAVAYVVAGASIVVKLTPTPADDAFLAKVVSFLSAVALNPRK
jgi:hypothetical protein